MRPPCDSIPRLSFGAAALPAYTPGRRIFGSASAREVDGSERAARRASGRSFSTGGYSAAPVMAGASSLRIPFVIHEANSMPGRSNRMFGKRAAGFSCTFRSTPELCPGYDIVRLGQPIRRELRDPAEQAAGGTERSQVLVVGGSQGARYLNEAAPAAAKLLQGGPELSWLLVSGPGNFEQTSAAVASLAPARFKVEPFLQASEMAEAYTRSGVAIGRSGGSLAEFALFRIPSVLTPLPSSADNHQLLNAREFEKIGAAKIVEQGSDHPGSADAERYAEAVRGWMDDAGARESAQKALAEWDAPDATLNILRMIEQAAA